MSFRTRLTSFFVLIVVVPMVAVGFLVFRLIGDSEQGKADARANGLATASASLYGSEAAEARTDAQHGCSRSRPLPGGSALARGCGAGGAGRARARHGERRAEAAGRRRDHDRDRSRASHGQRAVAVCRAMTVSVSAIDAADYARELGALRASASWCDRAGGTLGVDAHGRRRTAVPAAGRGQRWAARATAT